MNITKEETDIIVDDLEWVMFDELKCGIQHNEEIPCTFTVTHRLLYCKGFIFSCMNGADNAQWRLENLNVVCSACKRPIQDCWKVIPV